MRIRWMLLPGWKPTDGWNLITVSPNNRHLSTWLVQGPYTLFHTNVSHQPRIRGFHYCVQSTAISNIGVNLQVIWKLMEMEAQKKKGKVSWLLNNEWYIFEKTDTGAGIMHPVVGMMQIFVIRLPRSCIFAATLPPPFITLFSRWPNPWASKIHTFLHNCHLSLSV
jgi:hypothetical protein